MTTDLQAKAEAAAAQHAISLGGDPLAPWAGQGKECWMGGWIAGYLAAQPKPFDEETFLKGVVEDTIRRWEADGGSS